MKKFLISIILIIILFQISSISSFGISTGPIVRLGSPTHRDQNAWYRNTNVSFQWTVEETVAPVSKYYYAFDNNADTEPGLVNPLEASIGSQTFRNVEDGTWYFHLKAVDAENNSSIIHRRVNIDSTVPLSAKTVLDKIYIKGNAKLENSFFDNVAIDKIKLYLDNQEPLSLLKLISFNPLILNTLQVTNGQHKLIEKAFDKASNFAVTSQDVEIDNYQPRIKASLKSVVLKNHLARLHFSVKDPFTDDSARVVIKIKRENKTVRIFKLGLIKINKKSIFKFKASLVRGTYKFFVFSQDRAGNAQKNIASNVLKIT